MDVPQKLRDDFEPLDRSQFLKIREKEFRPHFDLQGLKYLRDKAKNELRLRELYRDRATYELLQNADDAGASRALFILTATGLAFVHDGGWFTVSNFRSLADGWSDKDPGTCIGHKGLGFRSVLDITPAPHVVRLDGSEFLAIKFAWSLNNGHIQETLKKDPSLRSYYEDWIRHGESASPVMAIPGEAKKLSLGEASYLFDHLSRGRYDGSYTTMFWFPATDPDVPASVLNGLGAIPIISDTANKKKLTGFLENEVRVLLPFLSNLQEVRIYDGQRRIGAIRTEGFGTNETTAEINVRCEVNGAKSESHFFQLRADVPIPAHVRDSTQTPRAVRQLKAAKLRLSVALEEGAPVFNAAARFHVYFPTEESSGVGFDIHADFFVKPDRTRLMSGVYNEWLFDVIAKKAAGDFLTAILSRYPTAASLAALGPVRSPQTDAAQRFTSSFSLALKERRDPFVPTPAGLVSSEKVIVPPSTDAEGFWYRHFPATACRRSLEKEHFLDPQTDNARVRAFLKLAGVEPIEPLGLIDLIEVSAEQPQPPLWWYDCYKYLSTNEYSSRWTESTYIGRKLVPTDRSVVVGVPRTGSVTICLAPTGSASQIRVPECFSDVFVFVEPGLSALLMSQDNDPVRPWVLRFLQVARFEASDLLPRAVRATVTKMFGGAIALSANRIREVWSFVQRITSASRSTFASDFWQEIGRLPVPSFLSADSSSTLEPETLVPAFLAYFPDSHLELGHAIVGSSGLRRVASGFLDAALPGISVEAWLDLLTNAGVSKTPKTLTYRRILIGGFDLTLTIPLAISEHRRFSGERQRDENLAVLNQLSTEPLWEPFVRKIERCAHSTQLVLQSLKLVEGLAQCTALADQEYRQNSPKWSQRLRRLVAEIPTSCISGAAPDTAFCRGGGGGHSLDIAHYAGMQFDNYRWLPTTCGPRSRGESFYRAAARRLISTGSTGEELGDSILPYIVAGSLDDEVRLASFGIEPLDDPGAATTSAITRAIMLIGERLSTEPGISEIREVRARWRLVRGALQEMYRTLNQPGQLPVFGFETKFAAKLNRSLTFEPRPLYYAEPGSPVENAFAAVLPIFDADRPYAKLFAELGVIRLVSGDTVEETLLPGTSVFTNDIRDQIVHHLASFLLATLNVKSERRFHAELVSRRLATRFDVKLAQPLSVSFSLTARPEISRTIDLRGFYLQRTRVAGSGPIEEFHYTLYVAGNLPINFFTLDGDALGDAIAPLFLDGINEEPLAALFPRITARYIQVNGNDDLMREFLQSHLGVSTAAQEEAQSPEIQAQQSTPITIPPPPPLRVIPPAPVATTVTLEQRIDQQRLDATAAVNRIVSQISHPTSNSTASVHQGPSQASPPTSGQSTVAAYPTAQQQQRGKVGELS